MRHKQFTLRNSIHWQLRFHGRLRGVEMRAKGIFILFVFGYAAGFDVFAGEGRLALIRKKDDCECEESANDEEWCSNTGLTYSSLCLLKCDMRKNEELGIRCRGGCPCEKLENPENIPIGMCNGQNKAPDFICPFPNTQHCATDGNEYPDVCSYICKAAAEKEFGFRCEGKCPCPDGKAKTDQPFENGASFRAGTCKCKPKTDNSEVCGTDGTTYDSACFLQCNRTNNDALGAKCRGPCPCPEIPTSPLCTGASSSSVSPQQTTTPGTTLNPDVLNRVSTGLVSNCPAEVPRVPVCGNDGVTYDNACEFLCAQTQNPNLGAACTGKCPCIDLLTNPECTRCRSDYRPICGSDNIVYGNPCTFYCASKIDSSLTSQCRGECPCVAKTDPPLPNPTRRPFNNPDPSTASSSSTISTGSTQSTGSSMSTASGASTASTVSGSTVSMSSTISSSITSTTIASTTTAGARRPFDNRFSSAFRFSTSEVKRFLTMISRHVPMPMFEVLETILPSGAVG